MYVMRLFFCAMLLLLHFFVTCFPTCDIICAFFCDMCHFLWHIFWHVAFIVTYFLTCDIFCDMFYYMWHFLWHVFLHVIIFCDMRYCTCRCGSTNNWALGQLGIPWACIMRSVSNAWYFVSQSGHSYSHYYFDLIPRPIQMNIKNFDEKKILFEKKYIFFNFIPGELVQYSYPHCSMFILSLFSFTIFTLWYAAHMWERRAKCGLVWIPWHVIV